MERSGRAAPAAHELDDLRQLTLADGPFLTVWASRPGLTPNEVVAAVQSVRDSAAGVIPDGALDQVAEPAIRRP